ncbi:NUDIX domain-containing protein [Novosphingobium sp. SL115]|uniref:NUDIX domain-containing protein n=1 Tax=Novosphingobium sp. SL115 TaxID=2995150 RepID=UPI00227691B2|nr:NUDIX domain-containing protein [Novosphingobium sp. SL115]MCY1672190.1 NUDIX domain-containing protein [Novosphingobium sp. SL115]
METHDIEPENWLSRTVAAATIVIFRRDPAGGPAQLLMVERNASLKFAGGATVFPGGKVDPADLELAEKLGFSDLADGAAQIAAVRETLEETGLVIGIEGKVDGQIAAQARQMLLAGGDLAPVLDAYGWTLVPQRLVPFARWWPRHRTERIFDTRFYLADLGTGAVDIEVDATENRHLFWASAQGALDLAEQGAIKVIFPTRRNLERLARFDSFEAARTHARATPVDTISPYVEQVDGQPWLMIPDGLGYPVRGEPLEMAARG